MGRLPDFTQLKRVAFRNETVGKVKELTGFAKGHSIPDRDSVAARRFVARIAAADIQADLDQTYQALRENFGFKRRELEASVDAGHGVIRAPYFVYGVSVDVDPRETKAIRWRREISKMNDPLMVRTPAFQAAFGSLFNALIFEFADPLNVADLVDRLEEEDRPGLKLAYGSDLSTCEITVKGFRGAIRVDRNELAIEGQRSPTAGALLDQFLDFVARIQRGKDWPALR